MEYDGENDDDDIEVADQQVQQLMNAQRQQLQGQAEDDDGEEDDGEGDDGEEDMYELDEEQYQQLLMQMQAN